ncbi:MULTISPECIES: tyrosine-type recombinase/integrase [unclassified Shewanella]|uniref:tyrosine-type recombinase/integrase n=1 Tax=Shewanella TaxID=22 RepID=UPI0021D829D2|nr:MULTISPECIES: site-specific integrase [unclassified Shewanella]MCU8044231.1 site-specific integrase [Shewanella sp. SM68]MCU8048313.1 site-specific integrase [Shewanella sp. SM65]
MAKLKSDKDFTIEKLKSLPAVSKRIRYNDPKVEGLVARKSPSGQIVFAVYRKFKGKPIEVDICKITDDVSIEMIRNKARAINGQIAMGIDPRIEKHAHKTVEIQKDENEDDGVLTFSKIVDYYITDFENCVRMDLKKPISLKDAKATFKNHVLPIYADKKIEDIDATYFEDTFKKDNTVAVYNKILTFSKAALNFAVKKRKIPFNQLFALEKLTAPSGRTRVLKEDEKYNLFKAIEEEEKIIYSDIVWMIIETGARKQNVLSMVWSDIDLLGSTWTLKVKNDENQQISLSKRATEILQRRILTKNSKFVFPSDLSKTGHISEKTSEGAFWRRICRRAGVYSKDRKENLTIHDLRRTLATEIYNNTSDLGLTQGALGHKNLQTTKKHYAHLNNSKIVKAVQDVSDENSDILEKVRADLENKTTT